MLSRCSSFENNTFFYGCILVSRRTFKRAFSCGCFSDAGLCKHASGHESFLKALIWIRQFSAGRLTALFAALVHLHRSLHIDGTQSDDIQARRRVLQSKLFFSGTARWRFILRSSNWPMTEDCGYKWVTGRWKCLQLAECEAGQGCFWYQWEDEIPSRKSWLSKTSEF